MLTTVEAEVDVDGKVVLLEPLPVTRKSKALVTLLEENGGMTEPKDKGNIKQVLEVLKTARFKNRKSFSAEEIDAQVEEARNSWD
jgi:hypothetical protein